MPHAGLTELYLTEKCSPLGLAFFLEIQPARAPVATFPVVVRQMGNGHASGNRGVKELPILNVDAHMPAPATGLEEHQVSRAQLVALDGLAGSGLVSGGTGKLDAHVIPVGE